MSKFLVNLSALEEHNYTLVWVWVHGPVAIICRITKRKGGYL